MRDRGDRHFLGISAIDECGACRPGANDVHGEFDKLTQHLQGVIFTQRSADGTQMEVLLA
jgi:hypothetical protein